MIFSALQTESPSLDALAVWHDGHVLTYGDCANRMAELLGETADPIVQLASLPVAELICRLAAAQAAGRIAWLDESSSTQGASWGRSGVVITTSGTTGEPKPVFHTWHSLASAVHREQNYRGNRWLLAYEPHRFAGLQVIFQALLTGGCVVVPKDWSPAAAWDALDHGEVTHASGTPSFWRSLLHARSGDQQDQLQQITLGGEPADQPLLDALTAAFPAARLTQVYASTEMGVCFSVHDGQAGFPASYLQEGYQGCRMKLADDGELLVQSPRQMIGYVLRDPPVPDPNRWFATGDMIDIDGDRAYFVGRKDGIINVGGVKVRPGDVATMVRQMPEVEDVQVFGVPSSIVGNVVGIRVTPRANANIETLREDIFQQCRNQLPKPAVPVTIEFVDPFGQVPQPQLTVNA